MLLAHHKVNVNGGAGHLGSPLHIAVVYHKLDIISKLLKRGADPNFTDQNASTHMHKVMEIYSKNDEVSYDIV